MPEISRFFRIIITMYADDHSPPHFHAWYAEHMATIVIDTGEILNGNLPVKQKRLVQAWTEIHRPELKYNWIEGQNEVPDFKKISPLK